MHENAPGRALIFLNHRQFAVIATQFNNCIVVVEKLVLDIGREASSRINLGRGVLV